MNKGFLVLAIVGCLIGCTTETTSECANSDTTNFPEGFTKAEPSDAVPGSTKMSTVIGPLAPNLSKWGPDPDQPFSWPGRAVQRDAVFPQEPSEQLIYEIRLPEGSTLHKVHVWVDPVDGHTDIPASRAQTMLWTHNGGLDESDCLASAVTLGDSVPSYEYRTLLTMALDEPYKTKSDTRVFVYVFGEWGANTMPGLAIDTPEIVYSSP